MNSESTNWKANWKSMLSLMLSEYHKGNPGDRRSDREILNDLMDYFVETGMIKKDETGKYLLPEITYS